MRFLAAAAAAALLLVAGCAAGGGDRGGGAVGPGGGDLPTSVFPFETPPGSFVTRQGGLVGVRVEPAGEGAAMWITGDFPQPRRIEWRRTAEGLAAWDGPDRGVELLRFGASPGTTWESSGQTIGFEGWERVETPSGVYDCVRIRTEALADPAALIERQRTEYLQALRDLDALQLRLGTKATTAERLILEGSALHLEADLKWLDAAEDTLANGGEA